MKRCPNVLAVHRLSLYVAFVFLTAGCGRLRSHEEKPPGKFHSVTITWTASVSHVIGYNVYRTTAPGGSSQKLTPRPVAGTQFTDDTAVSGMKYIYYATAVDSKGIESKPSNEIAVSIPYP